MTTLRQHSLRVRVVSRVRGEMDTIASFLRSMADSIQDTANRCTDPVIVSELEHSVEKLREKASEVEDH